MSTSSFSLTEEHIDCMLSALHCVTSEFSHTDITMEEYLKEHEDEVKNQILENQRFRLNYGDPNYTQIQRAHYEEVREKAKKLDEIVANPDYFVQTENALSVLREENQKLKEDGNKWKELERILKLCSISVNEHLDEARKNQAIVKRLEKEIESDGPFWIDTWPSEKPINARREIKELCKKILKGDEK